MFDGLGRLTRRSINGVPKEEVFYDNQGRVDRETYLVGSYTKYLYERSPLGRSLMATYPDGYSAKTEYGSE